MYALMSHELVEVEVEVQLQVEGRQVRSDSWSFTILCGIRGDHGNRAGHNFQSEIKLIK